MGGRRMNLFTNLHLDSRARRRVATLGFAGALSLALLAPAQVSAASVSFGTPAASSKFGTGITFTQPYSGGPFDQAEIAISLPGDVGPTVTGITKPGSSSLSYTMDLSSGGLSPFTPVTAHFQVVLSDGTVIDGPDMHVTYADDRFAWKSVTGGLVTIHWFQGTASFAQQLLSYGQNGLAKSAQFLGITETKPIDFYVYPSQAAFAAGLSVPETIGGQAEPGYRTCFALIAPNDLAYGSTVVPHELTHIVFADIVDNPYHSPPRWLNEGLAVYLSEGYGSDNRQLVSQAVKNGTLAPLAALAGYFALDQTRIYLSYAEAVSAVDYMVRKYGQAGVQKLVKAYAAASSDDEAFQKAFGVTLEAFDKAWMADNKVAAPTQYGPQPAPTGPLPPGWSSSGGGPGSGSTEPPTSPTQAPPASSSNPGSTGGSGSNDPSSAVLMASAAIASLGVLLLLVGGALMARERRRVP
jgi:hypothetical protein